jgi:hypothetical protein
MQSTQPGELSGLSRPGPFQRYLSDASGEADGEAGSTRLTSLNPSLLQDLLRFEQQHGPDQGLDMLEVVAAALRHNRALLLHLQLEYRAIPLTLLPSSRQLDCPLQLQELLALRLSDLRVLRVEPARALAPEGLPPQPLGPLLWELALRGARSELLPEIGGNAAYRVNPGADLGLLDMGGSLAQAVQRLRKLPTPLREVQAWPGFDRDRAMRLLNALYLQSALIVSRATPGG